MIINVGDQRLHLVSRMLPQFARQLAGSLLKIMCIITFLCLCSCHLPPLLDYVIHTRDALDHVIMLYVYFIDPHRFDYIRRCTIKQVEY
jgi:hypothetical protein